MVIAIQELQIFFFRLFWITVIVSIISTITLFYGYYWLRLRVYNAQLLNKHDRKDYFIEWNPSKVTFNNISSCV
jgi:hypothetical protein